MIPESIANDIPPQIKILKMNAQFPLKLKRCKPDKAACHPTKYDVINDVKLFPTVYCRIYCRKMLMLSNQTSPYKSKCIKIRINTCT